MQSAVSRKWFVFALKRVLQDLLAHLKMVQLGFTECQHDHRGAINASSFQQPLEDPRRGHILLGFQEGVTVRKCFFKREFATLLANHENELPVTLR
jgi:hypothetical protein